MADTKISDLVEQTTMTDTDDFVTSQEDASNKRISWANLKNNFPFDNYINGFVLSNDSGDTEHDINITAGVCFDSTNAIIITLSSEITKRIDAAWAVGDDAGGIDTGSVGASTLYAVWIIKRSDTGVVDALFSASFSSPTMPANYDYKRLLGWVLTDGSSNILQFKSVEYGKMIQFIYQETQTIASGLTQTTWTAQSFSSFFPTGSGKIVGLEIFGTPGSGEVVSFSHWSSGTAPEDRMNANSGVLKWAYYIPPNGSNIYYKVSGSTISIYGKSAIFLR